ncbi:MAG: gamma-glutamyl-gamma-aminobutyrate hydrolase family protein [Clostridiales bacterium]|nr:gamma-glutamyl-gamma-aminobutyrate hydrolase family protein [Clostridiales bacterium]
MLHALITQREGHNMYGKSTDVLEAAYVEFYESLGIKLRPVSNFTRNFDDVVDEQFDLLIVTGGGTLHPGYYLEPHNAELQPRRDAMEKQLIMYCVHNNIPIIGVCRGMQYLNALFGGKICYSARFKVPRPRGTDHMARIVKTDRYIKINNFHSDCVYLENLSTLFYPIVVDEDNGSVEAFVSPTMSILAFQWHPERYFESEEGRLFTRHLIQDFLGVPRDNLKPDID